MEKITRLKEQYFFIQLAQFVKDRTQMIIGRKIILCSAKVEISQMRRTSSGKIAAISAE